MPPAHATHRRHPLCSFRIVGFEVRTASVESSVYSKVRGKPSCSIKLDANKQPPRQELDVSKGLLKIFSFLWDGSKHGDLESRDSPYLCFHPDTTPTQ